MRYRMKHILLLLLCVLVLWVPHAHSTSTVINALSKGELSPLLRGRTDVRAYYSGCETLENMLVMPCGGVQKRPGSYYIANAKSNDTKCRLVSFVHSTEQAYVLEFGDLYIRFYMGGGQIQDGDDPYEISAPYIAEDLFDLQFVQSADILYIVGSNYAPRTLSRSGPTSWTLSKIEFERGPFLPANTEGIEGTPAVDAENLADDGTASETGSTLGTSSGAVANTNDEDYDTYWQRRGYSAVDHWEDKTVSAKFTIDISFAETIPVLDKVKYWTYWLNSRNECGDFTYSRSLICKIKYGDNWHTIGTSTSSSVTIEGPWYNVTNVSLYMYTWSRGVGLAVSGSWLQAIARLYELEAWTPDAPVGSTSIYITPTNTNTYDRTLDNTAVANQEGSPNVVRIASTAHGFLAGDYVTIMGTTNYDGTHLVTHVEVVDTFDIEHAYTAETPAGTESASSRLVLTATDKSDIFDANHVDALWKITHTVASTVTEADFVDADDVTDSVTMQLGRVCDFTVTGTWTGTVALQRSHDLTATWKDVVTTSGGDNITYSEPEDIDDALYRAKFLDDNSGTAVVTIVARSFDVDGVVQIVQYMDPCNVRAIIKHPLGGTDATKTWAEGAWSVDEGYPSTIALYEERQIYANTIGSPQTIWLSETDVWHSFLAGVESSDSFERTIASNQVNIIQWMSSQTSLMLGTTGGGWKIFASGVDEALTPDNLNAKQQSGHGSAHIQAMLMNNSTIFVQRQGSIVRKLQYSFDLDVWLAPNLTILSEHITGEGLTQIAMQKIPYSILWGTREDGELIGLTMEESQEVLGWHHHDYGGNVESVAVRPSLAEDEIWIAIKRVIDSNTVRYIEQIQPTDWGTEQSSCFFVDSGLSFDGGDAVTLLGVSKASICVITATAHGLLDGSQIRIIDVVGMTELNDNVYSVGAIVDVNSFQLRDASDSLNIDSTGFTAYTSGGEALWVENAFGTLDHLEGETISALGDGGYYGQETVALGIVVLDDYYNRVHIGLPYTAKVKPMTLSMASEPGALFGVNQRITEVLLRLHETLDCEVGADFTTMDAYAFREWDDPLEAATPVYTGDKILSFPGSYERQGNICIQSAKPLPLTVLGVKADFEAFP